MTFLELDEILDKELDKLKKQEYSSACSNYTKGKIDGIKYVQDLLDEAIPDVSEVLTMMCKMDKDDVSDVIGRKISHALFTTYNDKHYLMRSIGYDENHNLFIELR